MRIRTKRSSEFYLPTEAEWGPLRAEEMIDFGGRKLQLVRAGHGGPTVIFESGLGGTTANWNGARSRRLEAEATGNRGIG